MKILVTGGAGYIGSHTIVDLLASNHEILAVDNFVTGNPDALRRAQLLSGKPLESAMVDIRDTKNLIHRMKTFKPDAVVHFAGLKAVGESIENPLKYYDHNVSGTISLLAAMDQVRCKKIVFSSSATVYGDPLYLPCDEKHSIDPKNPYGRTKVLVEQLLQDWASATPGATAISLRYFNPVGAHPSGIIGEDPEGEPTNLMPLLAQAACGQRNSVKIYGNDYNTRDGTGERDFIHVVDLASAHTAAVSRLSDWAGFDAINVGTGRGHTVLELIAHYETQSGRTIPREIESRRAGDVARSIADSSKANQILQWSAKKSVEDMCRDSWTWKINNMTGYRRSTDQSASNFRD